MPKRGTTSLRGKPCSPPFSERPSCRPVTPPPQGGVTLNDSALPASAATGIADPSPILAAVGSAPPAQEHTVRF